MYIYISEKKGSLSSQLLAVLATDIRSSSFPFRSPYVSVRVSNELGANHPKAAKFSVVVATATSAAIGVIFTAVALAARKQMPRLFTGDDVVVRATAKLGYLLAATIFLNSIQPVLSGTRICIHRS